MPYVDWRQVESDVALWMMVGFFYSATLYIARLTSKQSTTPRSIAWAVGIAAILGFMATTGGGSTDWDGNIDYDYSDGPTESAGTTFVSVFLKTLLPAGIGIWISQAEKRREV